MLKYLTLLLCLALPLAGQVNTNTLTITPTSNRSATGIIVLRDTEATPKTVTIKPPTTITTSYSLVMPTSVAAGALCAAVSGTVGTLTFGSCGGGLTLPYSGSDATASTNAFTIAETGSSSGAMSLSNSTAATPTLTLVNSGSGGTALTVTGSILAAGSPSGNIGSLTQEFSTIYAATFSGQILHAYYTYSTSPMLGSAFNVGPDQTSGQNAPVGSPAGDYALAITNQNSGGTGGGTRIIEFGGLSSDNTTIYGNFYPNATDTYSIGKTGYEFLGGYFKDVTVTGTCTGCGGLALPYSGTDATASTNAFTISETGSSSGAMSLTSSTAATPTLSVTNSGTNGYAMIVTGTIEAAGSGTNNIGTISQEFTNIYAAGMLTQDLEIWTSGFTGTDWRLGIDVTGTTSGGGNAGVIINHLAQNVLEFPGGLNAVILMGTLDPPTANTGNIGTSTYPFGNGYFQNITVSGTCTGCSSTSGADVHLDNLASVAINANLGFGSDNMNSIGASAVANRPNNIYAGTSVESPLVRVAYISGGSVSDYFDFIGGPSNNHVLEIQDAGTNILEYDTGYWEFSAHAIPTAANTYDLGTPSDYWRNFYAYSAQLTGGNPNLYFIETGGGTDSNKWVQVATGTGGSTTQQMEFYTITDAGSFGQEIETITRVGTSITQIAWPQNAAHFLVGSSTDDGSNQLVQITSPTGTAGVGGLSLNTILSGSTYTELTLTATTIKGADLVLNLGGSSNRLSNIYSNNVYVSSVLEWGTALTANLNSSGGATFEAAVNVAAGGLTVTGGLTVATGSLTLSPLTGTQCLQEISGVVSGTGSACGSGGGGVTSITGTSDEIIASSSTGAVTLSTPQAIATTSSPTFAALTLGSGGNLNISSTGELVIPTSGTHAAVNIALAFSNLNVLTVDGGEYLGGGLNVSGGVTSTGDVLAPGYNMGATEFAAWVSSTSSYAFGVTKTCTTYPTVVGGIVTGC